MIAKLAALLAVVAVALWADPATPAVEPAASPSHGGIAGLMAGMVPVLFSFGGWQFALWLGGEIRDPVRNVPRAILVGVTVVAIVYLAANWAYLRLLGLEGVAGSPALAADAVSAANLGAPGGSSPGDLTEGVLPAPESSLLSTIS